MRRAAAIPVLFLSILHIVLFFPGFFSPYGPAEQHRAFPFAPPMRLHFVDAQGNYHFRPFVYAWRPQSDLSKPYEEDRSKPHPVLFFVAGTEYRVAGIWPVRMHLFGISGSGNIFLLGTDDYGRDQFSRLIYGAQMSLLSGFLATFLATGLGLLLGGLAGYFGRWLDETVMATAELFLSVPWLYLLLAARAMLPLSVPSQTAFLAIVCLLGIIGWPRTARLVRGVVLSAKEREYVLAARGFGASHVYLLRRHVLPQTRDLLFTQAALLIPHYILAEITLSFLGLGVSEPTASLGLMLASLRRYHVLVSYWWMGLPALLLATVFAAYYALSQSFCGRHPARDFNL